jgi:membrane protein YdbS with pleckstrin-like domain
VPAEHSTTATIGETEAFAGSHVMVGPGMATPEMLDTARPPATAGVGAAGPEGEETLWEGTYSSKNFLGRASLGGLLGAAWVLLAVYAWGLGHANFSLLVEVLAVGVIILWMALGYHYFRARRYHHYRLTTHRLFLTTGILHRRVDQVELARVKDLYVRQNWVGSWLNLGTVVLISSEATLPKALLVGIEDPRRVMDLVWYQTRIERDERSTEVNQV